MLPQESTNAEQIIAVAGGESSSHDAAFVNGMDSLYPDVNGEFIFGTDNMIIEEVDTNETGFLVDSGRPLLASKQPITRIGSDLEVLITEHRDEDNDINSIFDFGKAPTSHAAWFNAAHSGILSYVAASFRAVKALPNTEPPPPHLTLISEIPHCRHSF
ncbi:hypothetical protein P3S67_007879 [Capsicum chacoense]